MRWMLTTHPDQSWDALGPRFQCRGRSVACLAGSFDAWAGLCSEAIRFRISSRRWARALPSMTRVSTPDPSRLTHRAIPPATEICLRVGSSL